MGTSEKFCLRWNDFENNISGAFRELREDKDFFDVTLACDDDQMQAHKVILSACSPFFRAILRRNRHEHPLLYLKGVKYADLVSVLNFMYHGEVNVAQEELNSFLAVAEDLKVKGLTQNNAENKSQSHHQSEIRKARTTKDQIIEKPDPQILPKRPPHPPPSVSKAPQRTFQPDDDIQEVLPIKTEPVSIPVEAPTPTYTPSPQQAAYPVPEIVTGELADPNMEYADDYGDYEAYDGADASYGEGVMDNSGLIIGAQDGTKEFVNEFTEAVEELLIKTLDPSGHTLWQCAKCDKTAKVKIHIREHVETHHIENFMIFCTICSKSYRTRKSMRTHYTREHSNMLQHLH